jgi:predicted SAM-dependent methyltransferase
MSHILEHLDNPIEVLREVHRIMEPGAILTIKVPHMSSRGAWSHAEHKHAFNVDWIDSVTLSKGAIFQSISFKVLGKRLHYSCTNYRPGNGPRLHERMLDKLISINLRLFERVFIYWVGGCEEIEWVLQKNHS